MALTLWIVGNTGTCRKADCGTVFKINIKSGLLTALVKFGNPGK